MTEPVARSAFAEHEHPLWFWAAFDHRRLLPLHRRMGGDLSFRLLWRNEACRFWLPRVADAVFHLGARVRNHVRRAEPNGRGLDTRRQSRQNGPAIGRNDLFLRRSLRAGGGRNRVPRPAAIDPRDPAAQHRPRGAGRYRRRHCGELVASLALGEFGAAAEAFCPASCATSRSMLPVHSWGREER